jgi:hypothetical protein
LQPAEKRRRGEEVKREALALEFAGLAHIITKTPHRMAN